MTSRVLLLLLVLTGCATEEPEPVPVPVAGHGGADVRSAADRSCVQAGESRDLAAEAFTGSSSVTLAQVRSASGAADGLAGTPYVDLPGTHPVTACFYDDGRAYTSLLVDADGRVALNPAAPQGPRTPTAAPS